MGASIKEALSWLTERQIGGTLARVDDFLTGHGIESYLVGGLVRDEWVLDFSTLEDSIEQDLARRDFTVNAMAIDPHRLLKEPTGTRPIDPFEGLNDLLIFA